MEKRNFKISGSGREFIRFLAAWKFSISQRWESAWSQLQVLTQIYIIKEKHYG